jgi:pimeloyl-ACP methyl ester carboxylesterase
MNQISCKSLLRGDPNSAAMTRCGADHEGTAGEVQTNRARSSVSTRNKSPRDPVMMDEVGGRFDFDVCGAGPTIVLVPGSCSTGATWRPVISAWDSQFRCVTTSLLGYGGTAERRTAGDPSIAHEADMLEAVIERAGGRVHLVGHSFGGLAAGASTITRLAKGGPAHAGKLADCLLSCCDQSRCYSLGKLPRGNHLGLRPELFALFLPLS